MFTQTLSPIWKTVEICMISGLPMNVKHNKKSFSTNKENDISDILRSLPCVKQKILLKNKMPC